MDELEKRVQQFNSNALPGQPKATHMGTAYLVNDLWREVQRLRKIEQAVREHFNVTQIPETMLRATEKALLDLL